MSQHAEFSWEDARLPQRGLSRVLSLFVLCQPEAYHRRDEGRSHMISLQICRNLGATKRCCCLRRVQLNSRWVQQLTELSSCNSAACCTEFCCSGWCTCIYYSLVFRSQFSFSTESLFQRNALENVRTKENQMCLNKSYLIPVFAGLPLLLIQRLHWNT